MARFDSSPFAAAPFPIRNRDIGFAASDRSPGPARILPTSTSMEMEKHPDRQREWGVPGPEWAHIERLLELARSAPRDELSPERRQQILERVLARVEKNDRRRRRARFLLAAAAVVLLGGFVSTLVRARLSQA